MTLDFQDHFVEKIKAAIAALSENAGVAPLGNADSHYWAWAIVLADDNDPAGDGIREERRQRFEAVSKSARSMLAAVEALRKEEAYYLHLDFNWQRTLRFCDTLAEREASQKPQRARGRKAKLGAFRVAHAALVAFEEATKRDATITVSPTSSTAGGPYLEFVEYVFRVMGIDASPEHYARKAIRDERSSHSASPAGSEG